MSAPDRPPLSGELVAAVGHAYGLNSHTARDLGGSSSLNVRIGDTVIRVYPASTTRDRVAAIQFVREALRAAGHPFATGLATVTGDRLWMWRGHLVEAEQFVPGTDMDLHAQLEAGLRLLGAVHSTLATVNAPVAADRPRAANHVSAPDALEVTRRGVAALPVSAPPDMGTNALELAERLRELEVSSGLSASLTSQLVHGDFWDNNVLFAGERVAVVLDLDFMGRRPRVDDLGLTLYYTNSDLGPPYDSADRIARLAALAGCYDAGLASRLTGTEREALVYALARTILFAFGYMPNLAPVARPRLADEIRADVAWSLEIARAPARWHGAFAGA